MDGTRLHWVQYRHKACEPKAVNPKDLMANPEKKSPKQIYKERQKHSKMRDSATDVVSWKLRLTEGLGLMCAILRDHAIFSFWTESTQLCHMKLFFQ